MYGYGMDGVLDVTELLYGIYPVGLTCKQCWREVFVPLFHIFFGELEWVL